MGLIKLSKSNRKLARSREWNGSIFKGTRAALGKVSADEIMCDVMDEFASRKIEIKERRRGPDKIISRNKTLWVTHGFFEKDDRIKAAILAHELVHYRQRDTFGPSKFEFRYIMSAQFRVAMEIPAYAEEVAAISAMGASNDYIDKWIDDVPAKIKTYFVGALDWKHTRNFILDELRSRNSVPANSRS